MPRYRATRQSLTVWEFDAPAGHAENIAYWQDIDELDIDDVNTVVSTIIQEVAQ